MDKVALITGITGQDGSYLTELLIAKGYAVHGIVRRSSSFSTGRIDHLYRDPHDPLRQLTLHYGDLADSTSLRRILEAVQPDEIYNLAAQSHVKVSFEQAEYTGDVVATGTLRLLESMRDVVARTGKPIRYYQAGSSEMFGAAPPPQSEATLFYPRSPYAVAKVAAYWYTVNYREAYGLFACNGILFNHESERRGETFVTRKITRAVGRIKYGLQKKNSTWATSTPSVTGALPAITSKPCGGCSSRQPRMTTSSPRVKLTRYGSFSKRRLPTWSSTGGITSRLTHGIFARRKSITCLATPARRGNIWAGNHRFPSRRLSPAWLTMIWNWHGAKPLCAPPSE